VLDGVAGMTNIPCCSGPTCAALRPSRPAHGVTHGCDMHATTEPALGVAEQDSVVIVMEHDDEDAFTVLCLNFCRHSTRSTPDQECIA